MPTPALDVLIIGAGISGLASARLAQQAGLSAKVLEARPRLGGRLHSQDTLDLGATWFWEGDARVKRLVDDLGIETHRQHTDGDALYHSPNGAQRLDGNPIDVPAGRFTLGANHFAKALGAELSTGGVHFEQEVIEIASTRGEIEVRTADAVYRSDQAILALPPALAVSQIQFTPELPEALSTLAAATPVWMGGMAKFVARYPSAFWRRAGLSGAAISHIGPMREIHDMSGPGGSPAALFGFAPTVGGTAPSQDQALHQLGEIFGPPATEPEEVLIQNWSAEVHTSPPGVERLMNTALFGHPLFADPLYGRTAAGGRLHWASTETSAVSPGHIEGALAAAERALMAILKAREGN